MVVKKRFHELLWQASTSEEVSVIAYGGNEALRESFVKLCKVANFNDKMRMNNEPCKCK